MPWKYLLSPLSRFAETSRTHIPMRENVGPNYCVEGTKFLTNPEDPVTAVGKRQWVGHTVEHV